MSRELHSLLKKCYLRLADGFKPESDAASLAEDVLVFLLLAGMINDGTYEPEENGDYAWQSVYDSCIETVSRLLPWFSDRHRLLPVPGEVIKVIWTGVVRKGCYPADLLGAVHEMALGMPDKAPDDKDGKNTPGGTKRKRQGSYYTPPEVVGYMVQNTIGRLAESDRRQFRAVDPACGSAAFLSQILRNLLEYYRGHQVSSPAQKAITHLYGVDSDRRAVDLTVLGLALECCVRKDITEAEKHIRLLRPRILTGDSLTMNWQREFPEVFQGPNPGFDLVTGNPPYLSNKALPAALKEYIRTHYQTAEGQYDIIVPFVEKGLEILKEGGRQCFIVSNKYLAADYGRKLRAELLTRHSLLEVTDLSSLRVFAGASVYPVIHLIEKGRGKVAEEVTVTEVRDIKQLGKGQNKCKIPLSFFRRLDDMIITPKLNKDVWSVLEKAFRFAGRLPAHKILCGIAKAGFSKWVIDEDTYSQLTGAERATYRKILNSGNIDKFTIKGPAEFISDTVTTQNQWHSFAGRKLVIAGLARQVEAAVDGEGCALGRVYYIREHDVAYDLGYLCAILNSKLMDFFYRVMYWPVHLQGGYYRFNSTYLARLPIPAEDENREPAAKIKNQAAEMLRHGQVDRRLSEQLDRLVFQLYKLSEKQIAVINNFLHNNSN